MSKLAKCSWKLDTPGSVPAGARISAGKLGSVEMSLPNTAESEVNRSPGECMHRRVPGDGLRPRFEGIDASRLACLLPVACLIRL